MTMAHRVLVRFLVSLPLMAVLSGAGPPGAARSQAAEGQTSLRADFLSRTEDPAGRLRETRHLTLRLSSHALPVAPASRLTLTVEVTPKAKMHVYAPEQKDVIPIGLVLDPSDSFRASPPRFPTSERYFFAPLDETQRVYSKPFRITQEVRILDTPAQRDGARPSGATITIRGTVRYQACDEAVCYLPEDVPVSWTIPLHSR
jgi:hypothetical protein